MILVEGNEQFGAHCFHRLGFWSYRRVVDDANESPAASAPCEPVLSEPEASRRVLQLSELQASLTALGVRSVLARNHRLVLRYNSESYEPSGLTDPKLHVFIAGDTLVATTDGTTYTMADFGQYSASDPAAAAAVLARPGVGRVGLTVATR
jgi:hypothetical protein